MDVANRPRARGVPQQLAYRLEGVNGITLESWW